MAFEQVEVILPNGQRLGTFTWSQLPDLIRQRRLPSESLLIDSRTLEQRTSFSFPELAAHYQQPDDTVASVIPYRNRSALIGYYLGVFSVLSCIPFLGLAGLVMAIAALVLGVRGWRNYSANPQLKGQVHAVVAMVMGGLSLLAGLTIHVLVLASFFAR